MLNKFVTRAVIFTASTTHNVAKDSAIQICGPVAGTIQYEYADNSALLLTSLNLLPADEESHRFNLNLHFHAGETDSCRGLVGGSEAAEAAKNKEPSHPKIAPKIVEISERNIGMVSFYSSFSGLPSQLHSRNTRIVCGRKSQSHSGFIYMAPRKALFLYVLHFNLKLKGIG